MKCVSTLDVKVDNSLKEKRCVLVLTGHGTRVSVKERTKESAMMETKMLATSLEEMLN